MKTIALCFNTPDLHKFRDKDYGKKYPGAGWMKHLNLGLVVTGRDALESIYRGSAKASSYVVVQEELNPEGIELINMGADARVLTCLESPIFTPRFYDQVDEIKSKFKHSILFNGGTEHLYFPSFDVEDIREPKPWAERQFLCMVTANKHYSMLGDRYKDSPSFQMALKTQLHDYRYQAINHFYGKPGFDLYGKGWGSALCADGPAISECADKLETIRNYKFALCFENGSYPGYITEKIIDCFVAGVIPIYEGCKNLSEFGIPPDLYLASDDWDSFGLMEDCLKAFNNLRYIERAQKWLRTPDGLKYSNQYFANRIMELCQ